MNPAPEQSISISEFTDFCVGWPLLVQRAVESWIRENNIRRVHALAVGGGTDISLPRDDIMQLFQNRIIEIDHNKVSTSTVKTRFDAFLERHDLTIEDLKPNKK